jgi:hypothetical protein
MMVRIIIVGRDADPVECLENAKTEAVEKRLIVAFGPGLLKRGRVLVTDETLSGDCEFHVTGKIFSYYHTYLF